jgi:hypothetical protein
MDDQAKADYDQSLVPDKDFYKVKLGKFGISLKWLFTITLGGFVLVLAASEGKEEENACPNDYKIKKIKINTHAEPAEEPKEAIIWKRTRKTTNAPDFLMRNTKDKHIYAAMSDSKEADTLQLPKTKDLNKLSK